MRARAAVLAAAGMCALASCTPAAPAFVASPAGVTSPAGAEPAAAGSTAAQASAGTPSAHETTTTETSTTPPPKLVILSGTSIGDRPLGRAGIKTVDPILAERLGEARIGRPQLCRADGDPTALAVIDHSWPGLTVHYGSSGTTPVAIGWAVSLAQVPEGFQLSDGLTWTATFTQLSAMRGAAVTTTGGVERVQLTRLRITYTGPAGARRPDTITGGTVITCG